MADGSNEPGWIWKIFGGTILAMVTLLLVTLFNNINQNISASKQESINLINEIKGDIRENRQLLDSFKDRIGSLENNEAKTKLESLSSEIRKIENDINVRNEKVIANETSLTVLREDMKSVREELRDIKKEIQTVREKMIAPPQPTVSPPETTEKK